MRRAGAVGAGLVAWIAVASPAAATWSVVAVDPETQEVGVAVASCVEAPFGTTVLPQVAGLAPGIGALAVQALYDQRNRDQAMALLVSGASPQELIDTMVAGDPGSATRQYGVVTLDAQVAAFTGSSTQDWASDAQGSLVTVQGNILYGPEVVDDALAAFGAEAPRCPWTLADRLMVALEAGAAQGGDNRCSEEQSALAAVIQVAGPGDAKGAFTLDLRIPSQPLDGDNPVLLLRAAYDQWRQDNPPDDSACGGESSSGGPPGTGSGSVDSATSGGSTSGPPSGDTTVTTTPSPTASSSTAAADPDAPRGCGCRSEDGPGSAWWALAVLPWWSRRRLSRRARR